MSQSEQVQVRSLRVGQPLTTDLTDASGVLMLRAGVKITQGFIDTLTRRGIRTVATRETDEARQAREQAEVNTHAASPAPKQASPHAVRARPGTASNLTPGPNGSYAGEMVYSARRGAQPRLSLDGLNHLATETEQVFGSAIDHFMGIAPELAEGKVGDLGFASDLIDGFKKFAGADPALVLMLLRIKGDSSTALYRHGIKSALLSMTLATQMGFGEDQITDAGVAALVHDVGMLRLPDDLRQARRALTPAEWQLVREHPTHTLNLLDRARGVTDSVKTAAFQVHERCDASGYPRQRPKQFIHPMARVIGVADTYAALTDDRPHRSALNGHEAIKTILREVQAGKHDRAVARALLDTMSMFPVGTLVGLSDGRTARVLRSIPGQSIQPVVVVIKDGQPVDWELDLGQVGDLAVTRVLPEDTAVAA